MGLHASPCFPHPAPAARASRVHRSGACAPGRNAEDKLRHPRARGLRKPEQQNGGTTTGRRAGLRRAIPVQGQGSSVRGGKSCSTTGARRRAAKSGIAKRWTAHSRRSPAWKGQSGGGGLICDAMPLFLGMPLPLALQGRPEPDAWDAAYRRRHAHLLPRWQTHYRIARVMASARAAALPPAQPDVGARLFPPPPLRRAAGNSS